MGLGSRPRRSGLCRFRKSPVLYQAGVDMSTNQADTPAQPEQPPHPRPALRDPNLIAILLAVLTLICPGYGLSVSLFTLFLELPWCPPELAEDLGIGDVFSIRCTLFPPCANRTMRYITR